MINDVSDEARTIASRLAAVPVGGFISHDEISQALGRPYKPHRHLLYTALRIVLRESGAAFACERGLGYRRLAPHEAPALIGSTARARIRGHARRGRKTIVAAIRDGNALPRDVRLRANAEVSTLGMIEHLARDRPVLAAVPEAHRVTSPIETCRAFLDRLDGRAA